MAQRTNRHTMEKELNRKIKAQRKERERKEEKRKAKSSIESEAVRQSNEEL